MTVETGALLVGLLANAGAIILAGVIIRRSSRAIVSALEVVHHATNSMKDELVAAVRIASRAEGHADAETEAEGRGDVRGNR